jgi:hypothetical protein
VVDCSGLLIVIRPALTLNAARRNPINNALLTISKPPLKLISAAFLQAAYLRCISIIDL